MKVNDVKFDFKIKHIQSKIINVSTLPKDLLIEVIVESDIPGVPAKKYLDINWKKFHEWKKNFPKEYKKWRKNNVKYGK